MAIRTGKISALTPLETGKQSHLLAALARNADELSSGKDWQGGISDLIADLGRITGANRVWLFQVLELSDKHMLMSFPFEWVDEHTRALKVTPRYDTVHWDFESCSSNYRKLVESRRRGEWQSVIIEELEECDFKEYQMGQGVKSTLTIPVMVQGKWWGLFGLDNCTQPYQWSNQEISLMRMAAHLISSAVLNSRLTSTNRQFEILSNLTESNAWALDVNTGYFWCNSNIISCKNSLQENIHIPLLKVLRHIHPDDRNSTFRDLRKQSQGGNLDFRKDLRFLRDNKYVWSEIIARLTLDSEGRLKKMTGIIIDIPQRKEKEERLLLKATLDPLTGIANRGAFDTHFTQVIRKFEDTGIVFSLLLLDIDHFKNVNDTWGHSIGDQAIKHVTKIIQNTLRDDDFFARIGGEEFAIFVHCVPPATSEAIGERIRRNIEASPLVISKATVSLTVSLGISIVSSEVGKIDCETIFLEADEALYEAKNTGRNKVVTR